MNCKKPLQQKCDQLLSAYYVIELGLCGGL